MKPQDPFSNNPANPAVPSGSGQSPIDYNFGPVPPGRFSGRKPKLLIAIVVGVVVLIAAAVLGFTQLGGMPLREYSERDFSILVPKDYEQKKEATGISFHERGDTETQSRVLALISKSSTKITKTQQDRILSTIDSDFEKELKKEAGNNTITDFQVKQSTYKHSPARTISANIQKDNQKVGTIKGVVGVSDSALFFVIISAYESDTGLLKSTDKIIDSLQIK